MTVTRYHSLMIEPDTMPDTLTIDAKSEDGLIMAVRHKTRPVFGVQFHPESIATHFGHRLLGNFLTLAGLPIRRIDAPQHLELA